MNFKSTSVGKYTIVLISLILSTFLSRGHNLSPKLKFVQPKLVSGVPGQENAIYQFSNIIDNINALTKIADFKNDGKLVNIDGSTLGHYHTWQSTLGGPSTYGDSYIKWEITFKTSVSTDYTFTLPDFSAIDIDGDNVRVREFTDMDKSTKLDLSTEYTSLYFKSINNIVHTLGVTYRSFDVNAINNTSVCLSWITENEINNDRFEIERSFDQKNFNTVALIFGQEDNTPGLKKYDFTDKTKDLSPNKVVYYRLKQIDLDGHVTYSAVKMVRFKSASQNFVQVYPNLYVDKITLLI